MIITSNLPRLERISNNFEERLLSALLFVKKGRKVTILPEIKQTLTASKGEN